MADAQEKNTETVAQEAAETEGGDDETQPYVRLDRNDGLDAVHKEAPQHQETGDTPQQEAETDDALLEEFDRLSSSESVPDQHGPSPSNKRRNQLSPRKAMASAAAEDLYADAEDSRVDSGSTSTTTSKARKRREKETANEAISDATTAMAGVNIQKQNMAKDMKSFVRSAFPSIGLSSWMVVAMSELPESIILQLSALLPTYLKSAADIDMNVITQMLDEADDVKKIHIMMAYQSYLMHQAMGLPTDSPAQQDVVSTNANGTDLSEPEAEEHDLPLMSDDISRSPTDHESDNMNDSDQLGDVEFEPYAFDAGEEADGYATLAQDLNNGNYQASQIRERQPAGQGDKARWQCVEYDQFDAALWQEGAGITAEEVTEREQLMAKHLACLPEYLKTAAIKRINYKPWTSNLPCGKQPLFLANGWCDGQCKYHLLFDICANGKGHDMHQFRGRVNCADPHGPGHGKRTWAWIDMVLGHAERSTTRDTCMMLAKNWKPQVLQALAHRKWMDTCNAERAAGRDDPQTAAKKRTEAERRQLQSEADAAAADRAQPPTPAPTRTARQRRGSDRQPQQRQEPRRDTVWDRMPDAVRQDARFVDTIPANRSAPQDLGQRRVSTPHPAAQPQRPRDERRRPPRMRQTALDGANPAPSRRERDRQALRRHGPGRPYRRDTH